MRRGQDENESCGYGGRHVLFKSEADANKTHVLTKRYRKTTHVLLRYYIHYICYIDIFTINDDNESYTRTRANAT